MSVLSKWAHRAMPLARKINAISGQLGKPHIHEWDHGTFQMSRNERPTLVQKCELCGERRIIPLR